MSLHTKGKRWYAVCMPNAIAYYRVSTRQQQRSGLGIEAQRTAVARFAEAEGLTIIAESVEAETGKGADALDRRPQLAASLAAARPTKCSVLVSNSTGYLAMSHSLQALWPSACRLSSPNSVG